MKLYIKEHRWLKKVPLTELSKRTGISVSQLSQMENRKRPIQLEKHLLPIAKALGVSAKRLFCEDNDEEGEI